MEQTFDAGIFRCELVGQTTNGLRWKLQNTNTSFVHFTYGTAEEVKGMCVMQTEAWERKAKLTGRVGSAWRTRVSFQKKPQQ